MSLTVVGLVAMLVSGCRDEGVVPTVDCKTVTPGRYSELTIWTFCIGCHAAPVAGGARRGAPNGVNYDSYDAAKAHAVPAAAQVNGGLMPPSGAPRPSAEEKTALYNWALCGTPN